MNWAIISFLLWFFLFPSVIQAKVKGQCANCHTMHYSQHGGVLSEWGTEGPYESLLVNSCVGCHSSNSFSTHYDLGGCEVPVVLYTGAAAPTIYLAGGNFWWVKEGLGGDDTKGHNVFLNEDDDSLLEAPGNSIGTCGTNSCHENLSQPASGEVMEPFPELKGKYGCQGCHLNVKHHASDHANGESGLVDSADKGWYRFLSGHMGGMDQGVEGYEDGDWEASTSPSDHNEYLGSEKTTGRGFANLGHTTTAFCTGCHGVFHDNQGSESPWLRHPTAVVLPNSGEYASAFGATGGVGSYNPLIPVARPSLPSSPDSSVHIGTDIVMCLSCHRPHGSPYPKLMRWDYQNWPGGETNGCAVCHTEKD